MTTGDFITALFSQVDDHLPDLPTHPHASLWPSAVGTLGLLHALNGVGHRAFYRWLTKDERALFPRLPERPRLFRLFRTHQDWPQAFLASPTGLGVIDPYGLELIHPRREGRRPQQIGRTGLSNHRWMVGGTLCLVLHQWGWGGVALCHRQGRGYHLAGADAAVRRAHGGLGRHGLACRGGRSCQPETLPARRVAGPPARRDGVVEADAGPPFQEGDASGLGVFSGTPRVHHGGLQCAGPVAWLTTQRGWLRAPLDGCVESVRD